MVIVERVEGLKQIESSTSLSRTYDHLLCVDLEGGHHFLEGKLILCSAGQKGKCESKVWNTFHYLDIVCSF